MKKLNKSSIILIFITLLGLLLRIISINKVGGLWFDEITSYTDASHAFPFGIINAITKEGLHPPLYFFFLHIWMNTFSHNDIALRLFSVIAGTFCIPTCYFIGKELLSKKMGLILALFICFNSLWIYYSQEVRFYSFFILLVSLSVLFLAKCFNKPTKNNFITLSIINIACIYTSSLGLVFVGLEIGFFLLYSFFFKKELVKSTFLSGIASLLAYIPYLSITLYHMNTLNKGFLSIFDWGKFSPEVFLFILQDWLSPVLVNLVNHPYGYYNSVINKGFTSTLILLVVLPSLIYIISFFKAFQKDKNKQKPLVYILFLTALALFIIEVIFTIKGKFTLVSRYTMPIGLIFIIISAYGLAKIKNKNIFTIFISTLFLINTGFIIISSDGAPKKVRHEGLNAVATILKNEGVSTKDTIIMPFGGLYLKKYDNKKQFNIAYFDMVEAYHFNKPKALNLVMEKDFSSKLNRENARGLLKQYISSKKIEEPIINFINDKAEALETNSRLIIVISNGITYYSPKDLNYITQNDNIYNKQSLLFMLASKNKNDLLLQAYNKLKFIKSIKSDVWQIFIFEKQTIK